MARLRRLAAAGYTQHIIQRGNNRQLIFVDDDDRRFYLRSLMEALDFCPIAIHAYVLMSNHVHVLATPQADEAASRMMQHIGRLYVRYFNRRHGRTGTLWEGRYRSTVIDSDSYFMACALYIENNPVRAQLATTAEHYSWSSARHHLGLEANPLVTDHPLYWALGNTPFEREAAYRTLLADGPSLPQADAIRQATQKGWALGSIDFANALAKETGRRTTALPRGRKTASP